MRNSHLAIALAMSICGVSATAQKKSQEAGVGQLFEQFEKQKYSREQFYVAKSIVETKDASVVPKLAPWLTNTDRQFRGNAAFILAGIGDPRGFDVILAIVKDFSERTPTPNLGAFAGPASAMPRAQIKSDRDYAVWLLGQLKDRRAVPVLVSLLDDADVNYEVAWALGQIGDRSAIQPLIRKLSDPDPRLRVYSIDALANLKATEALPTLQQLVNDDSLKNFGNWKSVGETAQAAIAKLSSKTAH